MTKQALRALIIEDSEMDTELLILELTRAGYDVSYERVCMAGDLRRALQGKTWDIIFSDHSMPQFNSLEALRIRNEEGLDTPFIILSGTIGEDMAVEAMKAGASDYMVKGKAARLIPAVNRELQEAREREARRKTERELEHFIASLTHDLRTPLWAESRIFELFDTEATGSLNAQQHELMKELLQSNRFMQHMVNNILYAYRYKQRQILLNKESIDMGAFIASLAGTVTVQSLLQGKSHQLVLRLPERLPLVAVDQDELQRVLLNLIKNAVDYTPKNGLITISTKSTKENRLRVCVQDTGPGIDPTVEPHLFMPYTTSRVKKYRQIGIGLGLYLSRQIVEAHGGVIGYESRPGQGSLFYFELPCIGAAVSLPV